MCRQRRTMRSRSATGSVSPDRAPPPWRARRLSLAALHHGIALVDPVVAKIFGDVEHPYLSEAERMQRVIGGGDVWTVTPGTASAIDDDRGVFGQLRHPVTQQLQAGVIIRCADVFGIRDMSLRVKLVKTHMQQQR